MSPQQPGRRRLHISRTAAMCPNRHATRRRQEYLLLPTATPEPIHPRRTRCRLPYADKTPAWSMPTPHPALRILACLPAYTHSCATRLHDGYGGMHHVVPNIRNRGTAVREARMAESRETGSVEEDFRCPTCGMMFATNGKDEGECPNDGTHCTRDTCLVINASREEY